MTIIRNKQTGLEIEGERIPSAAPGYFNFKIPGTSSYNSFACEDWDIINMPKEGFYIWALPEDSEGEPNPERDIYVYRDGLWGTQGRKTDSGSSSYIQGTYERGELRRLTFAEGE